jgi:hypothetical protein
VRSVHRQVPDGYFIFAQPTIPKNVVPANSIDSIEIALANMHNPVGFLCFTQLAQQQLRMYMYLCVIGHTVFVVNLVTLLLLPLAVIIWNVVASVQLWGTSECVTPSATQHFRLGKCLLVYFLFLHSFLLLSLMFVFFSKYGVLCGRQETNRSNKKIMFERNMESRN